MAGAMAAEASSEGASLAGNNESAPMVAKYGKLAELAHHHDRCQQVIAELGSHGNSNLPVLRWILPATKTLSMSKHGTRVIQKAIEVADGCNRDLIIDQLKGQIIELYHCPHGNYVITKIIEVLPPTLLGFILKELNGHAITLARHQFGCRVLERLMEHCSEHQEVAELVDDLLKDAEPLCRHQYGNFVIQHIFEHGSQTWKDSVTKQITGTVSILAKHRTASHVVQKALDHGAEQNQRTLVLALMRGEGEESLVDVACSRYGSYVVEQLDDISAYSGEVRQLLKDGSSRLAESQWGKRILSKFGLLD